MALLKTTTKEIMSQVKKVGSHYRVYDPVLNVVRKFTKKAKADDFAEALNASLKQTGRTTTNLENNQ